jgi:hypothetical protein
MSCVVAFDLAQTGYQEWGVLVGFAGAFLLSLLWIAFRHQVRRWSWRPYPGFMPFFAAILVLVVGVSFSHSYIEYDRLRQLETAGKLDSVEGLVTNFTPATRGRHIESFAVGPTTFQYASAEMMPGFHQPANEGGPIRAGQHVRIAYSGPHIVKLEICT